MWTLLYTMFQINNDLIDTSQIWLTCELSPEQSRGSAEEGLEENFEK